jgi:hypothetical protein
MTPICETCKTNPSTVHHTEIVGMTAKKRHFCKECVPSSTRMPKTLEEWEALALERYPNGLHKRDKIAFKFPDTLDDSKRRAIEDAMGLAFEGLLDNYARMSGAIYQAASTK